MQGSRGSIWFHATDAQAAADHYGIETPSWTLQHLNPASSHGRRLRDSDEIEVSELVGWVLTWSPTCPVGSETLTFWSCTAPDLEASVACRSFC